MRLLFLLIFLANLAFLGFGQGLYFGPPPAVRGSTPRPFQQSHQTAITLHAPLPTRQITR